MISGGQGRPRLLFFAEAVTLAHVARPYVLGTALQQAGYEVHLARAPRYDNLLGDQLPLRHNIESISPAQFTQALAAGSALYDLATLTSYVEEDLRLIARVQPQAVVGDFRLSLAVSAALAGLPYVAISNAYWSPFCQQSFPVPELPFTRLLGLQLAQALFTAVRPLAFAIHCLPMHKLRRHFGLPSLGSDLRRVYTHADRTLYADPPGFFSLQNMPASHRLIGPVVWSPAIALPTWWESVPVGKPCVYVTLGSSGQSDLLPEVFAALGALDIVALVSTAGAQVPETLPENVFAESYLPGEACVARADLVVCNGGSPTSHQALMGGVPVLGIASNLDQYLNMSAVERAGAGRLLRCGTLQRDNLRKAVNEMLESGKQREIAASLAKQWRDLQPLAQCVIAVNELLEQKPGMPPLTEIEAYR